MVGEDAQEFKRILCRPEEIVHAISSVIMVLTTKVVELEKASILDNVNISSMLLRFRG